MMSRRRFVRTVSVSLLAAPRAAEAQQTAKVYRIGLLGGSPPTAEPRFWDGFFQELRERGYVEGQNIRFEGRWYGDHSERLPTTSHPDPLGSGLAASLARPGRNVTGAVHPHSGAGRQAAADAQEVVPEISRVTVLSNPTVPSNALLVKEAEVATRSLKMRLQVLEARDPGDFAGAFSAMTKDRAGGLIALSSSMFMAERARIVKLATQSRLPSIYTSKEYAEAGGLMAYGASIREHWRPSTWTRSSGR